MRIAMVGGIFDMDSRYRSFVRYTPETILADGLESLGHELARIGHRESFDPGRFDVVHVHHAGWGVVQIASSGLRSAFVYTNHRSGYHGMRDRSVERLALMTADRIVALSQGERDALCQRGVASGTVVPIPNGVDAGIYRYVPPEPPSDGIWRVLYVGQLIRKKGVEVLLRALHIVGQSRALQLELVYQNDTDLLPLTRLAEVLGMEDCVRFTGALTPEDLSEAYARSHIVALASADEALPSVLTEAMLVGRRIVATDVGSVREQVGEFAVLVEPGSVEDLAAGLSNAIETFAQFCAADAGRMQDSARRRFSVESMAKSHELLYRQALDDPARHRSLPSAKVAGVTAAFIGRCLGTIGVLRRPS